MAIKIKVEIKFVVLNIHYNFTEPLYVPYMLFMTYEIAARYNELPFF